VLQLLRQLSVFCSDHQTPTVPLVSPVIYQSTMPSSWNVRLSNNYQRLNLLPQSERAIPGSLWLHPRTKASHRSRSGEIIVQPQLASFPPKTLASTIVLRFDFRDFRRFNALTFISTACSSEEGHRRPAETPGRICQCGCERPRPASSETTQSGH